MVYITCILYVYTYNAVFKHHVIATSFQANRLFSQPNADENFDDESFLYWQWHFCNWLCDRTRQNDSATNAFDDSVVEPILCRRSSFLLKNVTNHFFARSGTKTEANTGTGTSHSRHPFVCQRFVYISIFYGMGAIFVCCRLHYYFTSGIQTSDGVASW